MNDTHGVEGKGWYGFDLDGTLAKYDGWRGIDHIGEPVKPMVDLIKRMHDEGKVVKIVTARVAPKEKPEVKPNPYLENHWVIESPDDMPWAVHAEAWTPREFIQDWCARVLGFVPEIVYQKDHLMLELYDDRVKQVVPNEGFLVENQRDGALRELRQQECAVKSMADTIEKLKKEVRVVYSTEYVDLRMPSRLIWACFGALLAAMIMAMVMAFLPNRAPDEEALRNALNMYIEAKSWPMPAKGAK